MNESVFRNGNKHLQRMGAIRATILALNKGTLCAVSALGLFVAGVLIFARFVSSPDETGHLLGHLLVLGVPVVLLAIAVHRLWRPRSLILRVARALFVLGTLVLGFGQLAESIGAFTGNPVHRVGLTVSPSGLPLMGLAILLVIAGMVKERRRVDSWTH